ncbi:hypothetical protein, partial [Pedobacter antarcticus]
MREEQILIPALNKLKEVTGINAKILNIISQKRETIDAIIEISKGQQSYVLEVEVKNELRTAALSYVLNKRESTEGNI